MNKYIWSLFLNWSTCFSQIDSTFQNVLVSAFDERQIFEIIADRGFIETGAVYIFLNSKFEYAATNFHTRKINIPGWESEGALIFENDKYKAYVFGGVIELGGNTDNKVKNVIVFDKIELDPIEAQLWRKRPLVPFY